VAGPVSRVLSSSQLALLAEHGEERTASVGDKLFEIGDETYPFIAILEGEAAVVDSAGNEIVRHGASGFLGEMNLLSGQTVFLTAVVTEPMRYIAVEREELRKLLREDGPLSDVLLSAFVQRRELLQQRQGIGVEIVGPRDSAPTRQLVDFAKDTTCSIRRLNVGGVSSRPWQPGQSPIATTVWTIQTRHWATSGAPTRPPSSTAIAQPKRSTGSTCTPRRIRKMTLSAIAGGVSPTSIVGGISRSGTMRRNFSHAVVGANEPIPRVSKKLTTAPSRIASTFGAARSAMAARARK